MTPIPAGVSLASLRHISAEQLRCLGTPEVVYLRSALREGQEVIAILGADGTAIGTVDTVEDALAGIAERGLGLVPVH